MRSQQRSHPHQSRPSGPLVELSGASGDEQFVCSLTNWNFIRDLGLTFGWHPAGTTYLPQLGQRARRNPIKHDYQPGDIRDRKRVEAHDSAQWAAALEAAKQSPFISGMLRRQAELQEEGLTSAQRSLHSELQSFIEFARRGAFTISLQSLQ